MAKYVDILLVNPGNRLEQFAKLNELATVGPPLGIGMVAAYLREHGISVEILDAEAEFWLPEETVTFIEKEYEPLIVGLTAFTTKMTAAGAIIRGVKERMPQVKTLLGGHHASAIPRTTLQEEVCDFVLCGEGYDAIVQLIQQLKEKREHYTIDGIWYKDGGTIVNGGISRGPTDLDKLPFVAWDLLPMNKYRAHHWQAWDYDLDTSRFAMISTTLGCPFSCEFCSVNVVYGKRSFRRRSAVHVVAELKLLVERYGIRHVEIVDDVFTINAHRTMEVCDGIIEAGLGDKLNMWCFGRTDTVSPELMAKMKRAGINWIFMGFESGNDDVLLDVNKRQDVEQIKRANGIVREAGIHVGGNYIFGLPKDNHETMRQTLDMAKELNTEYANFFLTMPYPGTNLYQTALEKGIELPEKWGQYGFFAQDALPMRNDNLTALEILTYRDRAFEEYYHNERYQDLVQSVFGEKILTFLKEKILSKKLVRIPSKGRIRYPEVQ